MVQKMESGTGDQIFSQFSKDKLYDQFTDLSWFVRLSNPW